MSLFLLEDGSSHILLETGADRLLLEDGAAPAGQLLEGLIILRAARPRRGLVVRPGLLAPPPQVLQTPLHRRPSLTSGRRRPGACRLPLIFPPQLLYPVPLYRYPNPLAATSQHAGQAADPDAATSDSGQHPDPFAASSRLKGQRY